jgi:hypothetical protein
MRDKRFRQKAPIGQLDDAKLAAVVSTYLTECKPRLAFGRGKEAHSRVCSCADESFGETGTAEERSCTLIC